jgi:HK97 family phage major capsid protein
MTDIKTEVKEITEDELKTIVADGLKEIIPALKEEIKSELKEQIKTVPDKVEKTEIEQVEEVKSFITAVVNRDHAKLTEMKAVDSTTDHFGYTIPTTLAKAILEKRDKISKMRNLAFVFEMAGPFQLPTEGTGVTSYWVGENELITDSDPSVGKKNLDDYYLATRVLMPRKMLNTSAYNLQEYIARLSSRSIVNTEETSFVVGSGDGQPTGFRAMTGHNTEDQAGSALAYDDIINAYYGLKEQYRQDAIWMTSALGMKAIRKIKDEQGIPLFNVQDQTMMGRRLIESEDIPANLGSSTNETELWFFNPSYYMIKDGDKMFMDVDKIISKLQIELVVAEAIDGIYTLPEAAMQLKNVK